MWISIFVVVIVVFCCWRLVEGFLCFELSVLWKNTTVCKRFALQTLTVVTGICNPSKSRTRHHSSLKLDSKLKYLNDSKGSHLTTSAKMVVCFVMFALLCFCQICFHLYYHSWLSHWNTIKSLFHLFQLLKFQNIHVINLELF